MPDDKPAERRIETKAEAETLIVDIGGILERLEAVVGEETRLVRDAKVAAASALHETKAQLSGVYAAALETLHANATTVGRVAPVLLEQLRRRHEAFQGELQVNMAVLATARSVSETLVRGVADNLAERQTPKTYGARGRMAGTPRGIDRPIAVSRTF